jgi:hypothetical protein
MSLYEKMVNEAVGGTRAVLNVNREKRGGQFHVKDAKPYVDAVNQMKAGDGQSKEVIALHVDSVNAHFDIMTGLTDFVRPRTIRSSSTTRRRRSSRSSTRRTRPSRTRCGSSSTRSTPTGR